MSHFSAAAGAAKATATRAVEASAVVVLMSVVILCFSSRFAQRPIGAVREICLRVSGFPPDLMMSRPAPRVDSL